MGFYEDVAGVARDRKVRRLAERRAGSHELAEDALQETCRTVSQTKDPESIRDLPAFFCKSLIHEINRQLIRSVPIPVEDINAIAEIQKGRAPSGTSPPTSVENAASLLVLADRMLRRLDQNHDQLMATVPGRSSDRTRYRNAIVRAAKKILYLLLEGLTVSADWNAVLRLEYPRYCDEPGLARDVIDQRLSRARRDVQLLLQHLVSRDELAS